jgi:hypothetical protein
MDEQLKAQRGRPATGVTPKRNVRIGVVWDEAEAIAKARGEKMTDVIKQALANYVRRNRTALNPEQQP